MSHGQLTITSTSPEQTAALGHALAEILPTGAVVALRGNLAAGKTSFVQGMARHFSPAAAVTSPTFTLVNEYGANPTLYHLDLYRLNGLDEILALGCEELFDQPPGVCAVEWAERAEPLLPDRRVDVTFEHRRGDERAILIQNRNLLEPGWRESLISAAS